MIIWPLITLSGLFFLISPTAAYFPLFIGSIAFIIVFYKLKLNLLDLIPSLMIMSFFAMIVPGYTTYYRYVFPIVALLPYVIYVNKLKFKTNN
jgi:hypothetical protein